MQSYENNRIERKEPHLEPGKRIAFGTAKEKQTIMKSDLNDILSALRDSPDNCADVSEHWSQGRALYGGIAAALAVTAMRKHVAEDRSLRSLMVSFIGPVMPGKSKVEARVLRQGGNATQTSADIVQDGEVRLQALAAYGKPRQGLSVELDHGFVADRPKRDTPLREQDAKRMPDFLKFFKGRWMNGGIPFSGDVKNSLRLWAAQSADMREFPDEAIVVIADIPPPVLLSRLTAPAPTSSLSWSLEFVTPPEQIATRWFQLLFELEAAADGYTQQSGKIFSEDGRLAALSRQTMVYFHSEAKPGRRS